MFSKKIQASGLASSLLLGLVVTTGSFTATVVEAPAADAAACDPLYEICDGSSVKSSGKPTPPPVTICEDDDEDCRPTSSGDSAGTWTETRVIGGSKYFWETGTVNIGYPGSSFYYGSLDYSALHSFARCGDPRGYTDPAAGVTINLRSGVAIERTETFELVFSDRGSYGQVSTGVDYKEIQICVSHTGAPYTDLDFTVAGNMAISGPWDHKGVAMESVEAGGTRQRPSIQGEVIDGVSSLGKMMMKENKLTEIELRDPSNVATPKMLWGNFDTDLSYLNGTDEQLSDFGRYTSAAELWRDRAKVRIHKQHPTLVDNIYPKQVATEGERFFRSNTRLPMFFEDVTKVHEGRLTAFKITCSSNADAAGRFDPQIVFGPSKTPIGMAQDLITAEREMDPRIRNMAIWGDNARTYSLECGGQETNTDDVLQCKDFGNGKTIDGKPVFPILKAERKNSNGEAVELKRFSNGKFETPADGQPTQVSWSRGDIEFGGESVSTSSRVQNQIWKYEFRVQESKVSPKLKNVDINNSEQPVHGFATDSDNGLLDGNLTTKKWNPNLNWGFKSLPHRFINKPYEYDVDMKKYTYRWGVTGTYQVTVTDWCGFLPDGNGGIRVWCATHQETRYNRGWIKNSPPAGYTDNGSAYEKKVKLPAPAGFYDNGSSYERVAEPPAGFYDNGSSYTALEASNSSGVSGGIAFNKARSWVDKSGLSECTVKDATGKAFTVSCGDNVSEATRRAIFKFFQSSTSGSDGWSVTPYIILEADLVQAVNEVSTFSAGANGELTLGTGGRDSDTVREKIECPGEKFSVDVYRIATN